MRRLWILVALALLVSAAGLVRAQDLDGMAIMKKVADREESKSSETETKMILVDNRGQQRERSLIVRAKQINKRDHVMTTFLSPPDVRGVKFLVIENPTGDDDQRIYLPAIKRARRISSSQKSGSFMGSQFSYEDLQSQDPEKYKHQRMADMQMAGHDCYVVQSVPLDPSDTQYSKAIWWVRKDAWVPIRAELYDKKGNLFKVLEVQELEKQPDGTWLTKLTKMSDVQQRKVTIMQIIKYQANVQIKDSVFTERFLTDESQE